MNDLQLPECVRLAPLVHGFFDDFEGFITAIVTDAYTVVTAVDGTVLISDAVGGKVIIANATASIGDNEDCYLAREPEAFLFAADKPAVWGAKINFPEVSTNSANVVAGLTDGVAANLLVNDGAGMKTSGTTLAFYKIDGKLNWHVHVSLSTTQQSIELTAANSLDKVAHPAGHASAYTDLRIEFMPKNSTQADVTFWIDGKCVYKFTDWVFTSATEVQAVLGCKGGTAAALVLNADYHYCYQKR